MRATASYASVLAFAALAGCGDTRNPVVPQPSPGSVVGCYSTHIGPWSGPRESPNLPATIALLDSIGTNPLENGKTLARPDPINAPMHFSVGWWNRPESEHLDVVFSAGGIVGIRLSLVWGWGDGSWSGTAQAFTDVAPSIQAVATARLLPVSCASP